MTRKLGQDFADLKRQAREIPEVAQYLDSVQVVIGNIVFARRTHLGLTQETLAKLAGTKQGKISEIEAGMANIRLDTLNRVFQALGLERLEATFSDEQAASSTGG